MTHLVVDPRANGLNTLRLVLAASVILWHSFLLLGVSIPYPGGGRSLGLIGVDGFFAISGLLLSGSYLRNRDLVSFVRNRALRILPGFWVCLLVIAFVLAPLTQLVSGRPLSALWTSSDPSWRYVLANASTKVFQYTIAGIPDGPKGQEAWDSALWTLPWEMMAYIGLALLGVIGLLKIKPVAIVLALGFWAVHVVNIYHWMPYNYWISNGSRLGFMFMLGVLLHHYGDRIPRSPTVTWIAVVGFLASTLLTDYSVFGSPFWAYLVISAGIALSAPRFQLRDRDISYGLYIYGVPIQQVLLICGVHLGVLPFTLLTLVIVAPLAALSWVLVERPALRLKRHAMSRPERRASLLASGGSG